jgi:hypothetical protein
MVRGTKYKVMIMSQVAERHLEAARPRIQLIFGSLRIAGVS